MYYSKNAERIKATVKAYRDADPDAERKRCAVWRRANPEKFRAATSRWNRAHPESLLAAQTRHHAAHPDARRARNVKWESANPASVAASKARRRARVLNAPGDGVATGQWQAMLDESLGLCAYCHERRPLEMDHAEPLSRGGAHGAENVAAACMPCNRSKSNSVLVVWLARRAASRTLANAA
jgi:5-methylcytosine-specific restriction endonuclease McrA